VVGEGEPAHGAHPARSESILGGSGLVAPAECGLEAVL
jgi:hypothetical protein